MHYYNVKLNSLIHTLVLRPDNKTVYILHDHDKTHFWCFTFILLCNCVDYHCLLRMSTSGTREKLRRNYSDPLPSVSPADAPLTDLSKHAPPHSDSISQHASALVLVNHCGQANCLLGSLTAVVTAEITQHGRCQSLKVTAELIIMRNVRKTVPTTPGDIFIKAEASC